MAASAAQVEANRANGRKSRGPRTAEGKARSRWNAMSHGLCAQSPVLPGEDADRYRALLDDFVARFAPAEGPERELVERMALEFWRMRRARAAETAALSELADEDEPDPEIRLMQLLADDVAGPQIMFRFARYDAQAFRNYARARQELDALRGGRSAPQAAPRPPRRRAPPAKSAASRTPRDPASLPTVLQLSAEIGFVLSDRPVSRPALLAGVAPAALLAPATALRPPWRPPAELFGERTASHPLAA